VLIRNRLYASAQLYAFDLLELDGEDLRGGPIERRKDELTQLQGRDRVGLLGRKAERLLTIGGVNRQGPLAEKIAKKVIELAQTGDCDPLRLKELTLKAFDEDRIRSWRLLWRGQLP
jgi:hypothetical protein